MKKGIIIVIVIGITMILSALVITVLLFITQGSRVSEHKIRRTRAYYAAQAGIVSGMEQLRKGEAVTDIVIGTGITGYSGGYDVEVTYTNDGSGPGGTDLLSASVDF